MEPKIEIDEFSGKRLFNVSEMLRYTGLGRSKGLEWCKEIGALRHIGKRAVYDRQVIDRAINELEQ